MNRSDFLRGAATLAAVVSAWPALSAIPRKWDRKSGPPMTDEAAFVKWGVETRGENPKYLAMRWARYQAALKNKDLKDERNQRAFLMTPREDFVLDRNLARSPVNGRFKIDRPDDALTQIELAFGIKRRTLPGGLILLG